jgi:hypothetical protein
MENYQWCGESCFAGAAISIDGYLPQIPRRGEETVINHAEYEDCSLAHAPVATILWVETW